MGRGRVPNARLLMQQAIRNAVYARRKHHMRIYRRHEENENLQKKHPKKGMVNAKK